MLFRKQPIGNVQGLETHVILLLVNFFLSLPSRRRRPCHILKVLKEICAGVNSIVEQHNIPFRFPHKLATLENVDEYRNIGKKA